MIAIIRLNMLHDTCQDQALCSDGQRPDSSATDCAVSYFAKSMGCMIKDVLHHMLHMASQGEWAYSSMLSISGRMAAIMVARPAALARF